MRQQLRSGIDFWRETSDVVLVEGAGGLMSPISDDDYNADLAAEFGYPLLVVAANELGTINATLQTLITASTLSRRARLWPASCSTRRDSRQTIRASIAMRMNSRGAACRRCWPSWSTAAGSIARWIGAVAAVRS